MPAQRYGGLLPGFLARRLMRVEELMRKDDRNPVVRSGASVLDALSVMTKTPGRPGATSVVDDRGALLGVFTDGDLRRLLTERHGGVEGLRIDDVMTADPLTVSPDTLAMEALGILHQRHVDQVPVVNAEGRVVGMVDVQDLLDLRIG